MKTHPYLKYAKALLVVENELKSIEDIRVEHVISAIEVGLQNFRIEPIGVFEGKNKIQYDYCEKENGNPEKGIFLSPHIVSTNMQAEDTWNKSTKLLGVLSEKTKNKVDGLKKSNAPTTGEYLVFSLKEGIGRGIPKVSLFESGLCEITTLTQYKPCLQDNKGNNFCLIPDIEMERLCDFIDFFKRMLFTDSSSELKFGNVVKEVSGKGQNKKITYSPQTPSHF